MSLDALSHQQHEQVLRPPKENKVEKKAWYAIDAKEIGGYRERMQ